MKHKKITGKFLEDLGFTKLIDPATEPTETWELHSGFLHVKVYRSATRWFLVCNPSSSYSEPVEIFDKGLDLRVTFLEKLASTYYRLGSDTVCAQICTLLGVHRK